MLEQAALPMLTTKIDIMCGTELADFVATETERRVLRMN